MTYEDAKRIVDAVEEQKRSYYFHREAFEWLKLAITYPDDDYYRSEAIRHSRHAKTHSKNARILLGIED